MKPERRTNIYIYMFLIAIVCFTVYANSLNNSFLDVDDIDAIVKNPQISQFSRFWFEPSMLLNSFSYLIAGYNPFIYHLVSVSVHCINTILVFLFLGLFFNTEVSFLASLLFAVHPIHTEAITWISGRGNAITAFFILVTYLLYHRATNPVLDGKKFRPLPYLLSLLSFSYLIVHGYSFFFLFPLFLILYDVTFAKWRKNWKWWFPFLAVVIIRLSLVQAQLLHRIAYTKHAINLPLTNNPAAHFVYSFFSHLWLLLWPAKLTLYHEPAIIPNTILNFNILYLLLIMLGLFLAYKKAKEVFWGLGIFIIFLAPTYSPVPVASAVAERYIYFPSIALSIFLAFLYEKYLTKFKPCRKYLLAAFILVIIAYGFRTVLRNEDWKTPEIFWRKTVAVSPDSISAHNGLGTIYSQEGNVKRALQEFNTAIQINPNFAEAYSNRGLIYSRQGDFNQALQDFSQAIQINPDYAEAYSNRGLIYSRQGDFNQALQDFNQAIQINPNFTEAYNNRGLIYLRRGELNQALQDFNQAIQINPRLAAQPYYNRGLIYFKRNELNQALQDFNQAIQINPDYAEAYNNRGIIYLSQKEYDKSREDVRKAEKLGYAVRPEITQELKQILGE
jgi:protein O-mannosyl-transferase